MEIKNGIGQINPYQNQIDKVRTGQTAGQAAAQAARYGKTADAAGTARGRDTVTLSPEARLRTEAYSTAMNAPEVRQSKVDAIKARIASGEYQPDSRQIAGRLLAEEPGLFGA